MIITYPNPKLRRRSAPVTTDEIKSGKITKLISDMRADLAKAGGVGLAAVQTGILKRVILVETETGKHKAFINPVITKKSFKKIHIEEGCLSIPGIFGHVKRSQTVYVTALDENGDKIKLKATDLVAIIFQHEVDHINGVLFIDKVMKNESNNLNKLLGD